MTDDNLRQLKSHRSAQKANITKFFNYVQGITNMEARDRVKLKLKMKQIQSCFETLNNIQTQLEQLDASENSYRDEYEDMYFESLTSAEILLDPQLLLIEGSSNQAIPNMTNVNNATQNNYNLNHNTGSNNSLVKLPIISLPTFNGQQENWCSFYDSFASLIHGNESLADIQKFHYLKSGLVGDAAKVIETLSLSSANYSIAWEALIKRYENKSLIIKQHINKIFDIPSITKATASSIRSIIDSVNIHLKVLNSYHLPVDSWDAIIIEIVLKKLDYISKKEWEECNKADFPTFQELTDFLHNKCRVLDSLECNLKTENNKTTVSQGNKKFSQPFLANRMFTHAVTAPSLKCILCQNSHFIIQCPKFLELEVKDRVRKATALSLCKNCLRNNHTTSKCLVKGSCHICRQRHHSILHLPEGHVSPPNANQMSEQAVNNYCTKHEQSDVLLPTVILLIKDSEGHFQECRGLLDSGSQVNFITRNVQSRLGLTSEIINFPVMGINQSSSKVNESTKIFIKSKFNNFRSTLDCFVLDKITADLPITSIRKSDLLIPKNITLADPNFHKKSQIDLLIGCDIFWELLCVGQVKLGRQQPYLQKTVFGWIISGPIHTRFIGAKHNIQHTCNTAVITSIDEQLTKFWEIEEINTPPDKFTEDEQACEEYFQMTLKRDQSGRFIVHLPFKIIPPSLGESKSTAIKRFLNLERKLIRCPQLSEDYSKFINEYITLNHMTQIKDSNIKESEGFFLPHHAVVKEQNLTTKLRVVFDGSAKTSNGTSLNDYLMVGPTIQSDLFSLLLRFRIHKYVITADIIKMYRQIKVDASQRKYQRIVWRDNPNDPIATYELNTVTYGLASSPYLAIRCLHQIADNIQGKYPEVANIIRNDFYVDDLLTGVSTIEQGIKLCAQLISVFKDYGFELSKWSANDHRLIPNEIGTHVKQPIPLLAENETKTLGLYWKTQEDILKYKITPCKYTNKITKRIILSYVSQLFDPLGLLNPLVIKAKVLLQSLWCNKLDWDESVPFNIFTSWNQFLKDLDNISDIQIPRGILPAIEDVLYYELHGFSDASESAYGCCIYLTTITGTQGSTSRLICAKSRVAPVKTLSIPRLELCAALLLSKLITKVVQSINLPISKCLCWTDSTIVLNWLSRPPNTWKIFVANRTTKILNNRIIQGWYHVESKQNPADIISRGSSVSQLINCTLWWEGPEFLRIPNDKNRIKYKYNLDLTLVPEQRKTCNIAIRTDNNKHFLDTFNKFSSFDKLVRIMSYCIKFVNCLKSLNYIKQRALTVEEISKAKILILTIIQQSEFSQEISCLRANKLISNKSKLLSLSPFIDNDGLIRVGGRLKHSDTMTYDKKYPIILPKGNQVTNNIIISFHKKLMHAGTLATLSAVRDYYWPVGGKGSIRHLIHKCVTCFKCKPSNHFQVMGNLPKTRIEPARPFINCGVDYAGPFHIREGRGRGKRCIKAYLVVFLCFATKAIHFELVTDLSAASFLNSLKRFMARRGHVANLYSDNGTNFVGANKELKDIQDLLLKNSKLINDELCQANITWHFIPPNAPNFGGLWEAGVKAVKHHLKRFLGNIILTYEEMYSVLVQIEAILNSRPLTPLSSDPNDLNPLTPGHFLIGEPLIAPLEPDLQHLKTNRLTRWQLLEQVKQHFWNRWSREYLHTLQQRGKWKRSTPNIKVGSMVLIKSENLPPLRWALGRVAEVHPDKFGSVRVVTVKTKNGEIKRSVSKICELPIDDN